MRLVLVVQLRPPPTDHSLKQKSELVFNYDPSPSAFWITRQSDGPSAIPLFDTRISSLLAPSTVPVMQDDTSTVLQGFPLVFEDQYLQITSALPLDTNIYGLGDVIASSGFRRDIRGTLQTMWNRDVADPFTHFVNCFNQAAGKSQSHGVLLFRQRYLTRHTFQLQRITDPIQNDRRTDFYFFSGPDPNNIIEQYYRRTYWIPRVAAVLGIWIPSLQWGYTNVSVTRDQVTRMWEANIPLEDIPIVDAAIAIQVNSSDVYDPYTNGIERNTFIQNPDRSEYIESSFPDWFQPNTQAWWTEALQTWSNLGVGYSESGSI
ncbi:hypothetical protein JOM56_001513 [Amanita muscaria]